jgi:hypothetical protein
MSWLSYTLISIVWKWNLTVFTRTKLQKKIEDLPSWDTRAQVAAGTLHVILATSERWPMLATVSFTRASPYRREQVGSASWRRMLISLVITKVSGTYRCSRAKTSTITAVWRWEDSRIQHLCCQILPQIYDVGQVDLPSCQDEHHIQERRLGQRPSRETVSKIRRYPRTEAQPTDCCKNYDKDNWVQLHCVLLCWSSCGSSMSLSEVYIYSW